MQVWSINMSYQRVLQSTSEYFRVRQSTSEYFRVHKSRSNYIKNTSKHDEIKQKNNIVAFRTSHEAHGQKCLSTVSNVKCTLQPLYSDFKLQLFWLLTIHSLIITKKLFSLFSLAKDQWIFSKALGKWLHWW